MQVVARVQGLTMLNGSAVRQRERRDCELRYLRAVTGVPSLSLCIQTKTLMPVTGLFPNIGRMVPGHNLR